MHVISKTIRFNNIIYNNLNNINIQLNKQSFDMWHFSTKPLLIGSKLHENQLQLVPLPCSAHHLQMPTVSPPFPSPVELAMKEIRGKGLK